MTSVRTALIIGGGITGATAAMALDKAGIEPVIYEARPTGAAGVGTFLTLASNGIEALRLIDADQAAVSTGFDTPAMSIRSSKGKPLGESRTGSSRPGATISQTIKRADLYQALNDEAGRRGIAIEQGRRLVRAEQESDSVRAIFADGTEAVGDILIGCDGVHSTTRRMIDPAAPKEQYIGLLTNGGYTRGVPVAIEPGSYEMIFGRRGFFGYALDFNDEIWWFSNVPRPAEPRRGELEAISDDEWRHRLLDLFSDDAGPATAIIEASTEMMPMSPIHTMPHLPSWHRGRMIVIGDAAHAPSPTSGQGASLSIEDGVELATSLRDQPDVEQAYAGFVSRRRPRVERIIKAAARINNSKAAGPVARVFQDAMLPMIMKAAAKSKAEDEKYDYRIVWDSGSTTTTDDEGAKP